MWCLPSAHPHCLLGPLTVAKFIFGKPNYPLSFIDLPILNHLVFLINFYRKTFINLILNKLNHKEFL